MSTAIQQEWNNSRIDKPLEQDFGNVDTESLKKQERERYEQDTRQRKSLARWVMWATSIWLFCVLFIIFFQGLGLLALSSSVLNVLLATTTVNVLGLAYIVLNGLFGKVKSRVRN